MTREKNHSTDRRVILDLSWPPGVSVNSGIPKDIYLGEPYKLKLPTLDDLVTRIWELGRGCCLFTLDLARAYRQLRSDPLDWPLLGFQYNRLYYMDTAIPFGIRWGAMACQRTTNALCYIADRNNIKLISYIDDIVGTAKQQAKNAFVYTRSLLKRLGIDEADHKAQEPSTTLTWIGIEFDTLAMEMGLPHKKLTATAELVVDWISRQKATRHQLQQLLGKLIYVAYCCKPARLFVARMLHTLREAPPRCEIKLDNEFRMDLRWFVKFMPKFNGIQLIRPICSNIVMEADSCLSGCGAICAHEYYHAIFPELITTVNMHISRLEMLNLVVATKMWSHNWDRKNVIIYCDNSAAVLTLQHGNYSQLTVPQKYFVLNYEI